LQFTEASSLLNMLVPQSQDDQSQFRNTASKMFRLCAPLANDTEARP